MLIDADLQDPPEVILDLLSTWRDGYDVVYGQRSSRAGESWTTRATSHAFYRILRRLAPTPIPVDVGDFRLMDRAVVDAFLQMPERKRFVRGMIAWTGFRQTAVFYDRDARLAGETKYHFANRLGLAIDAMAAASVRPLRWIIVLGAILLATGCMAVVVLIATSLFGPTVPGNAWLASAMTLLAGRADVVARRRRRIRRPYASRNARATAISRRRGSRGRAAKFQICGSPADGASVSSSSSMSPTHVAMTRSPTTLTAVRAMSRSRSTP